MIMNYSYIPLFKDMPVLIKLITASYTIISDYDSNLSWYMATAHDNGVKELQQEFIKMRPTNETFSTIASQAAL